MTARHPHRPSRMSGLFRLVDRMTLVLFNPPPVMVSVARHDFDHRRYAR